MWEEQIVCGRERKKTRNPERMQGGETYVSVWERRRRPELRDRRPVRQTKGHPSELMLSGFAAAPPSETAARVHWLVLSNALIGWLELLLRVLCLR